MRPAWRRLLVFTLTPGCIVAGLAATAGVAALAAVILRLVSASFGGP